MSNLGFGAAGPVGFTFVSSRKELSGVQNCIEWK